MSLEVYGGGDEESLVDIVARYGYSLSDDGLWRENADDDGLTDQEMWEYAWDRRDSED